MNSFDEKINTENLTKCMQTLKQFYGDLHKDKVNLFHTCYYCLILSRASCETYSVIKLFASLEYCSL